MIIRESNRAERVSYILSCAILLGGIIALALLELLDG